MTPFPNQAEQSRAIAKILAGALPADVETETLDFKEDPAKRAHGGAITAGATQDDGAAYLISEASACLANHEGGTLVVGIDDKAPGTAAFIGTALDSAWLRARVRELTMPPVAVRVTELTENGVRLLVLEVSRNEGSEPHSATVSKNGGRRTPQRVGTGCHDMRSLAEQMAWLNARRGYDWSAVPGGLSISDARSTAIQTLRDYLREGSDPGREAIADLPDVDLLRRLQLVRDDGRTLNRGGALLLCPSTEPRLTYLGRPAASVRAETTVATPGRGLIEELREVERAISSRNPEIPIETRGLTETTVQAVPLRAIREALVNAVVHRDWNLPGPVVVEHTGDEVDVFSPGEPLVAIDQLLRAPSLTRNRLLADVFRSVGLAERQGTGIDRMYIELIRLGHGPPRFLGIGGGVRAVLAGGAPVPQVLAVHAALPRALRDDARSAIVIDALRRAPSLTREDFVRLAQDDSPAVDNFLTLAEDNGLLVPTSRPRPGGMPAWRLADQLRDRLGPVLPYYARPIEESVRLVTGLARSQGSVRNSDVQDLLGLQSVRASQVLKEAERQGHIRRGPMSASVGRGVWYVPTGTG